MYTKPTGFYAVQLITASGGTKFYDNYRFLRMARSVAVDLLGDYEGSGVIILKDTVNGWKTIEKHGVFYDEKPNQ